MTLAPPRPPSPDELEALIREARARQRRRWMIGAVVIASAAGLALAIAAVLPDGGPVHATRRAPSASLMHASARCHVRVVGTQILQGGRAVYHEPISRTFGHEIECSGRTIWVVFFNGVASSQQGYFGVRSGNEGRTWHAIFTERYFGMKAPHQLDDYLGPWTLRGGRHAYFTGLCPACGWGTVSLWVTNDGGRSFRRYAIPELTGYGPRTVRASGNLVTITARRGAAPRGSAHKTVTVRVA